jgi:hypothetical protein
MYVTLFHMDKESEEGRDGFKQFDEAVCQSTAAKTIIVYVCQSAFTQSWTTFNAGMRNNPGLVSGFLHVDSNPPEHVTKIACDLDIPEDGFLFFLNVGWHWIPDTAVLASANKMPFIPVPLLSLLF